MDVKSYTSMPSESRSGYGTIVMRKEALQPRRRRVVRTYLLVMLMVIFLNLIIFPRARDFLLPSRGPQSPYHQEPSPSSPLKKTNKTLIPLEAHIMSKCPDAKDCLIDLVVPAMEKINDLVDFRLSFIGSMGDDDNVQCMHGPDECLGNMLSLCAQQLFPHDAKRSLGFSNCMISQYHDIPKRELVEQCALEHGISFEDINGCISDEGRGTGLLEESIKRSREAGVVKSCTVRLAGEIWCIRDGGQWKNCSQGHRPSDLEFAVRNMTKTQNYA